MTAFCHGQERFGTLMGSDVARDCMYLELSRGEGEVAQVVAEAIWHDDTNEFTVDVLVKGLPFSVLELFMAEARRRLPPMRTPVEANRFEATDSTSAEVLSNNSLQRP